MTTNSYLRFQWRRRSLQLLKLIPVATLTFLLPLPSSNAFWLAIRPKQLPFIQRGRLTVKSNAERQRERDRELSTTNPLINSHPGPRYNLTLLIIDHYDSFTYNLYDYFAQRLLVPPTVISKDAFTEFRVEDWTHIDGIILSPGPGSPQEQPPLSHQAILRNPALPILGVCLGHQLMALNYGGTVDKAPKPIHGQDDLITQVNTSVFNECSPIFHDLPSSFRAVRYHSLAVYNLPDTLEVTARSTSDGVVQAFQHRIHPHFGVQFHPESIGTQHGMSIVENFCRVVEEWKDQRQRSSTLLSPIDKGVFPRPIAKLPERLSTLSDSRFRVVVHPFEGTTVTPEEVFNALYRDCPHAMWLDSSSASTQRGTLDILAAPTYANDLFEHQNDSQMRNKIPGILAQLEDALFGIDIDRPTNATRRSATTEIAVVLNFEESVSFQPDGGTQNVPFEYRGGFLGYLGYEVYRDTILPRNKAASALLNYSATVPSSQSSSSATSGTPAAAFFLARNSIVFHHPTHTWYAVSLLERNEEPSSALSWMKTTKSRIMQLHKASDVVFSSFDPDRHTLEFTPNRSKKTYLEDIARCQDIIRDGQSYELCLTNQLEAWVPGSGSAWDLYKILRRRNPAPYSAFFKWVPKSASGKLPSIVTICCSSPERFMCIKRERLLPDGPTILRAEAKPIKGTVARVHPENGNRRNEVETMEDDRRARVLELSIKDRAENLMIVDLLRNDMSRVCQIGSVHVAKLMAIETFQTVHQMVSTIRGTLSQVDGPDGNANSPTCFDLLRAAFPGGSMTGAPKLRTMELLAELEDGVERGPYSGCMGYLSVNGCMDMNIIIRSAVVTEDLGGGKFVRIGAGGAITALSESRDEYEEMLLKARPIEEAVQIWCEHIASEAHNEIIGA